MSRHQSALVSQTSFRRETSGGVPKCRLLSQVKINVHTSVLEVNEVHYGQRKNSAMAISRLSVRPNCIMGLFLGAISLPFLPSTKLCRTLGQTSSPKTKQKRKNTLYLSHKNPFNGLTIIFNVMKFLTLVFFYRPVATPVLYFLTFESILYSSRYFH